MTNTLVQEAQLLGIDYLQEISAESFDTGLIENLPVSWVREQLVLPIRMNGEALLVLSSAQALSAMQQVALVTGEELRPVFAEKAEILRAIDAAYFAGKGTQRAAEEKPREKEIAQAAEGMEKPELRGLSEHADLLVDQREPAAQYLNQMLLSAVRAGASDIHLEPEGIGIPARLRFRVAGRLYEQSAPAAGLSTRIVSRLKVLASMDIAEHRLPQDGMAQVRIGDRVVDIRVSTIPVSGGERAVLRLLNRDDSFLSLQALGMPERIFGSFTNLLAAPNGIIVVSGPTGSGKTTTLYSALGELDSSRRNIMTIEDPVEYRLPNIAQLQVKPKIGLTFASGLRHLLRQDPDVVLVGETRDSETAEIAVRAALTGHLVFTTLHTNDAPGAVVRLLDMGIESYLLSSCLRGVLAQRLVRKVCPKCGRVLEFGASGLTRAEERVARAAGMDRVLKAQGCSECLEGYIGRLGVFEQLTVDAAVSDAIHEGRISAAELCEAAQKEKHFNPMSEDAYEKVRRGITTPAEVASVLGI